MRRAFVVIVAARLAGCSSSEPVPIAEDSEAQDSGTERDTSAERDTGVERDTSVPLDAPDTYFSSENPPFPALAPAFLPLPGTYATPQEITLSSTTPAAQIYYTTDGTTPNVSSPLYTTPIAVNTTTTLKAVARAPGLLPSDVTIGVYTINSGCLVQPVAYAPAGGSYTADQLVTLSSETAGATICYSLDGSTPVCSEAAASCTFGTTYSAPIAITPTSAGVTVTSIACKVGMGSSCTTNSTYKLTP